MERLVQHNLLILPGKSIPACCEPNFPLVRAVLIYLEKHEPRITLAYNESIGNKKRTCVRNMIAGQDGV